MKKWNKHCHLPDAISIPPLGQLWQQILSTTQFVWLPQALAMFIECSYSGRYTADNYWESLEGAWYTLCFLFMLRKVKHLGKSPNRDRKWAFWRQMHSFLGFTPVEISSGFVKIFFRPNRACRWSGDRHCRTAKADYVTTILAYVSQFKPVWNIHTRNTKI